MNREIKFRAWITVDVDWEDNDIKEMTYDLAFEEYAPINDLLRIDALMQYTGLCDKNGKEIYEGDWCEAQFRDKDGIHVIQGQIIMDEYMWCLDASHTHDIYSINRLHAFEIIGNIYENPNLLK